MPSNNARRGVSLLCTKIAVFVSARALCAFSFRMCAILHVSEFYASIAFIKVFVVVLA